MTKAERAVMIDAGSSARKRESYDERGQGNHESGKRAGDPHVKQGPFTSKQALDADECAHGPNNRRRGDEIRIAGRNAMMLAGGDVSILMRAEDHEQS